MLLYERGMSFTNVCAKCSWPMLLGGHVEEEKKHRTILPARKYHDEGWITLEMWVYNVQYMCKFVCVKSQGYIAKGCTAHLPLPPPVVDWGLERQKACHLPRGMDAAHKRSAEVLWMMVS